MALSSREQQRADIAAGRDPFGGGRVSSGGEGPGRTLPGLTQAQRQGYIEDIKRTVPEYGQEQRVQAVGTTNIPYATPDLPFDLGSVSGLGKLAGGLTGPLGMASTFGKYAKYNYERQQATKQKIMRDFGVDEAGAQDIMDREGLNITDVYGADVGTPSYGPSGEAGGAGGLPGLAGAGGQMGIINKMFGGGGGTGGITGAVGTAASYQQEALDYLKEVEALPRELREGALRQFGGVYGIAGGEGDQQAMIERALASPLYGQLMGGREAGEEAILRSAAATGGLRGGNVQEALYDYNTRLQNQALLESYNQQMQGLGGLAQLPSYARDIAGGTAGIGTTLSQGQIAALQAEQERKQAEINKWMGVGQLGLGAYRSGALEGLGGFAKDVGGGIVSGIGSMFSDRRLKKNIKKIGMQNGWNIYQWDWNSIAEKMGMKGKSEGVMADEVYVANPSAVSLRQGFLFVNYNKLGRV